MLKSQCIHVFLTSVIPILFLYNIIVMSCEDYHEIESPLMLHSVKKNTLFDEKTEYVIDQMGCCERVMMGL